jgi:acetyl/propionyl-CoA carboxylase alpha subunit
VSIDALLVANRGEIAVRILQTAAAMGIRTIAVHAEDDGDNLHVRRADEAVGLTGSGPAAYLDAAQLVAAALERGHAAVHPGYGFLSENPGFARRCTQAGLVFVGPTEETLALFGDKSAARRRAVELGIPVLEGTKDAVSAAEARAFADGLDGSPAVMIKALAGGGGRGSAPVLDLARLDDVFARCRDEAQRAFGDGRLYVERLLPAARHIEVQLIGDGSGAVRALGTRDCSIQRRRQKLIEIAPAPNVDPRQAERLIDMASRLGGSASLRGLATVEFLVPADGDTPYFLEVNPRLQVEHTVTEAVTGLDLVELALRIAGGAGLDEVLPSVPQTRGAAIQLRVNTESLRADGTVVPGHGELARFQPPSGPGVRVDTHGYPGYSINPRYDSLLAKVITVGADHAGAAARAARALADFEWDGPANCIPLLRRLVTDGRVTQGEVDVGYLDRELARLLEGLPVPERSEPGQPELIDEPGTEIVRAPLLGTVLELPAKPDTELAAGGPLAVLESMKMEHVVSAPSGCVVRDVLVAVGQTLREGDPVARIELTATPTGAVAAAEQDLDTIRPDLAESYERHRYGLDEARPDAVRRRRDTGRRTARENIADLCDPDTFVEYGALAIAAQLRRRTLEDLIERTPADGMVTGTAQVGGRPCAVLAYDYTVLAGTQGIQNHRKTDRLLELAMRRKIPVVIFAEGGGGRPGDTDTFAKAQLDVPTFHTAAALVGRVPTIAVVAGYCFAGNAALAGSCDIIIGTEDSNLGMGGPAMIEGAGLGVVDATDVGPIDVQRANGVVDVVVRDEEEAVAVAKHLLSFFGPPVSEWECADQRVLRHAVPENRVRVYDVRPVLRTLVDTGSMLELRADFGVGIITALARIEGRAVGLMANDPRHLGGAIDGDAADKTARFLRFCQAYGLPVVSLCDTPGFMVGPDVERTAVVRRFADMFVAGARLETPLCAVVLRKGYGLGAMAMVGGNMKAPVVNVSWPTGEFGGMGLEGGVRLGFRAELAAIEDPAARQARYEELVAQAYERGKGLSVATVFEIDDVIDPADTRAVLSRALAAGND